MMTVVQCWDDGVTNDVPLAEVCRKHGAMATFNLNAGLNEPERVHGWEYKDTKVTRLGWNEMREVYDGFTIANHGLMHPWLEKLPVDEARVDIVEGRKRLQDFFEQPIDGFVYPYGTFNDAVKEIIREAGHTYARGVSNLDRPFPPNDAMEFCPNCKFDAADFWERYDAARPGGVFYFWGHTYEIYTEPMWEEFDEKIRRISADPESRWDTVASLFAARQ